MQHWCSDWRLPGAYGNLPSPCPGRMHSGLNIFLQSLSTVKTTTPSSFSRNVCVIFPRFPCILACPKAGPYSFVVVQEALQALTNVWFCRKPAQALEQLEEDSENLHYLPRFLSSLLAGEASNIFPWEKAPQEEELIESIRITATMRCEILLHSLTYSEIQGQI